MGIFDDPLGSITKQAQGVINRPMDTIGKIGKNIKGTIGSAGYATPFTAPFMVANDLSNIDKNRNDAQNAENDAKSRTDKSIGQMDSLRNQQLGFANQLRDNATRDQQGLLTQAYGGERRAMAEKLHQAKDQASARGILGGGLQQLNEATARSQAAANTANKQKQIQDMSKSQIQDANNLAGSIGLEMGGIQQNQSDQYYQMAIQNMNNRNQAYGQLSQGLGQIGGTAIANYGNPAAQTNNIYGQPVNPYGQPNSTGESYNNNPELKYG